MEESIAWPATEMLILQPTPFCNVDCGYCYLPFRSDRRRMSHDVLEAVFSKLFISSLVQHHLVIVWHAGEPLTVPPDWYEAAFALADMYRQPFLSLEHSFQSNGTLIDMKWVAFFRRTGAKISLSIDGPEWLHDLHRRTRRGHGTHARAMRGLRLLQQEGIRPATITVLTQASLEHADELFDFYRDSGITDVAFNVEELEGAHLASSMSGERTEKAYRAFMLRFIDRIRREPHVLSLRELCNAVDVLRVGVAEGCNQEAEPLRIVNVAVDGAVSTFSPELLGMRDDRYDNFLFGNILTDSIETIVSRVLSSRLRREISEGIANCRRTCGWFPWCGGGSPSNKIFEAGDPRVTETEYCKLTRQAVLDVTMSSLEQKPISNMRRPA
jgi:uncharacterized protein